MKLCLNEDEGMLSHAAWQRLGSPLAVIVDHDVVTGETSLRSAEPDDVDAYVLETVQRLDYRWLFQIDDPPLMPGGYRLRPNRDGSLTVDLTPCPT